MTPTRMVTIPTAWKAANVSPRKAMASSVAKVGRR